MDTIQNKGGLPSISYGSNGPTKLIQERPKASTSITTNQEDQPTRVYGGFEGNLYI
jgi:hypothetical protein